MKVQTHTDLVRGVRLLGQWTSMYVNIILNYIVA